MQAQVGPSNVSEPRKRLRADRSGLFDCEGPAKKIPTTDKFGWSPLVGTSNKEAPEAHNMTNHVYVYDGDARKIKSTAFEAQVA